MDINAVGHSLNHEVSYTSVQLKVSLVASQIATSASESDKEAAYLKIESLGYRVGCVLIER